MAICPDGHQTDQTDFCATCGLPIGQAPAEAPGIRDVTCPQCGTANVADALFCESCGFDFTADAGSGPTTPAGQEPSASSPEAAAPTSAASPADAASDAHSVEWVAEMWIDPDWYAVQGSTDPMPSVALPDIVPLTKASNLIGRHSQSRSVAPEIDCDLDTGCSRRHAIVTNDGSRWWIEDLDSANGTFVGGAAGPLPAMPIPSGRVELAAGQRIYVGAWTRIVIRKATAEEATAFGD